MIASAALLPQAAGFHVGHPDVVMLGSLPATGAFTARARLLAGRIDTRALVEEGRASLGVGGALTFVFRYGAVVSFVEEEAPVQRIDAALRPYLRDPVSAIEVETADIAIARQGADKIGGEGQILLADAGEARLTLVAIVLARSVVLSRDEVLVSQAFERIAPLVEGLRATGRTRFPIRQAMRLVGDVLAARHRVMASVQADERPDVLWDNPELDRLYARLEAEYELDERAEVLGRKFEALGDFAEVLLNIIQDKRAFRLELAIIFLIMFEIVLALMNMHWW
ncbi:MAG TPA: RMD1 family protein [Novosphingobium sp.]|nr:RMD1 family protein [Novosphingobium sp.]HZV09055.1 RMD1 family protein [Novosphingobium sp.]